jgi:hypothetical protein
MAGLGDSLKWAVFFCGKKMINMSSFEKTGFFLHLARLKKTNIGGKK